MIVEALEKLSDGTLIAQTQPDEGAVYAAKLTRDEARIDWRLPARQIERQVRALNPWPGVWFDLGGERVKVLTATIATDRGQPGTVLDDGLAIACGEGSLRPVKVQRAGKAPMEATEMLRGHPVAVGTVLD
jgi:methionyl-tRNA formyltransferase